MDFVQWCGEFLRAMLERQEHSETGASIGVRADVIGPALLGADWDKPPRSSALTQALRDLKAAGVVEQNPQLTQYLKIPRAQRDLALNQRSLWVEACTRSLSEEEATLLRVLNRHSERTQPDFAYLEPIPYEEIYSELGWESGYEAEQEINDLVRNLEQLGFALFQRVPSIADLAARPTYLGLVWEHRRAVTVSSTEIDDLVAEGETSTVDLKRQLGVDTASEKAELVKDVIALANTKATGRRYMVIGFTNEGDYYQPDDSVERAERDRLFVALNEERLQQIITEYTSPAIQVRYTKTEYHLGPVGMLEVLRDVTQLPYVVRKSVGDKNGKRVEEGQIFVRDGTVTRKARPEEIEQMKADAERAKRRLP